MLDDLGITRPLIAQGLLAPKFQYRSRQHGLMARLISQDRRCHAASFRLQCEQSKLTRIFAQQADQGSEFRYRVLKLGPP
jgi:3-(3-hydroxy-phenyl)propionate hydroxylase